MAIPNPFSITYGDREVGGLTEYQIHGPYIIQKTHQILRISCEVVVVAESFAELHRLSDDLEEDFRKRLKTDQEIKIDLGGTEWVYTVGEDALQVSASIDKTGNSGTDIGFARAYAINIMAELPADDADDAGLRDLAVTVQYADSRRKSVAMAGVYTATETGSAVSNYQTNFDARATAYLESIDGSAVWELVSEMYDMDREVQGDVPYTHICPFQRTYVELLADQSAGLRDDPEIRNHTITFSDISQYPGDSEEGLVRLHRVNGQYSCAVDIDETTDLQDVFEEKIQPLVIDIFRTNFEPRTFGIEGQNISYDETSKRVSLSIQFVYQPATARQLVEYTQTVTTREDRTIDWTPVHNGGEFAMYQDAGFTIKQRTWIRQSVVVGEASETGVSDSPTAIASVAGGRQVLKATSSAQAGGRVTEQEDWGGGAAGDGPGAPGWTVIGTSVEVTPHWVGLPGEQQIQLSTVMEVLTEQYSQSPSGGRPGLGSGGFIQFGDTQGGGRGPSV